jgi:hypothetical protein
MESREVLEKLNELWTQFAEDAEKGIKGNKAAVRRSRVASSKMTKLFKEWRGKKTE